MSRTETLECILEFVSRHYDIEKWKLRSANRKREIVEARHAFMYLGMMHGAVFTLGEVGRTVNKDHASVVNAKNKINNYLYINPQFAKSFNELIAKFRSEFELTKPNIAEINPKRTERVNTLIDRLDIAEDEIKALCKQLDAKNTEILNLIAVSRADNAELEVLRGIKQEYDRLRLQN